MAGITETPFVAGEQLTRTRRLWFMNEQRGGREGESLSDKFAQPTDILSPPPTSLPDFTAASVGRRRAEKYHANIAVCGTICRHIQSCQVSEVAGVERSGTPIPETQVTRKLATLGGLGIFCREMKRRPMRGREILSSSERV